MLGNRRTAVLTAVAASAGLVLASALTQSTAVAAPSSHKAVVAHVGTEKVIVVLRDQLASTPVRRSDMDARKSLAKASQNDVLDSLGRPDAKDVTHLTVGNAFVATVTTDQAAALAADPSVASVVKDSASPSRRPRRPARHRRFGTDALERAERLRQRPHEDLPQLTPPSRSSSPRRCTRCTCAGHRRLTPVRRH